MSEVMNRVRGDWTSNIDRLGVGVEDGVVELTGLTKWAEDRARAIEIAGQVKGVKKVVSKISVSKPVQANQAPRR